MDRFIATPYLLPTTNQHNLKSNMDRFIEQTHNSNLNRFNYLKSNMDRFIAIIIIQSIVTV